MYRRREVPYLNRRHVGRGFRYILDVLTSHPMADAAGDRRHEQPIALRVVRSAEISAARRAGTSQDAVWPLCVRFERLGAHLRREPFLAVILRRDISIVPIATTPAVMTLRAAATRIAERF